MFDMLSGIKRMDVTFDPVADEQQKKRGFDSNGSFHPFFNTGCLSLFDKCCEISIKGIQLSR